MSDSPLQAWLALPDDEVTDTLAAEIRSHAAELANTGGFYAYAVLSLAGDRNKLQHLSAAFNRESDLSPKHANEIYYRLSPNEWANHGQDVYPKSAELITARNTEFAKMHSKANPNDFRLDEFQIAHVRRLHRAILAAMKRVRQEGALGGESSFVVLWAPDSPDDVLYCSAKALNSPPVFEAFWSEFGDDGMALKCDGFE